MDADFLAMQVTRASGYIGLTQLSQNIQAGYNPWMSIFFIVYTIGTNIYFHM